MELHVVIPHFHSIVSCCQQESTVLTHSQGRALVFVHLRHLSGGKKSSQKKKSSIIWLENVSNDCVETKCGHKNSYCCYSPLCFL